MNELTRIQQEIEKVRNSLNRLVTSKGGNMADPEVATLSAYLDQLIVKHDQRKSELEQGRS